MHLLYTGAEAKIYKINGKVIKERVKKSYRIKELDERLRRQRTREEARLLLEARRAGVAVPRVLEKGDFTIVMEFIDGKKVKDILNSCSANERERIAYEIGRVAAKLHSFGMVHGDLTTSNMLWKEGKLYLIDFGLGFFSKKIEDFATELAVLKESLKATHNKYLNFLWEIIVKSYRENFELADKVLAQLKKVEKRGRYIKRA